MIVELVTTDFPDSVIIDEIPSIPELSNEVYSLIEKKNFPFILTGSSDSDRKLRAKGVNLLACRALTRFISPLTAGEMGAGFLV